MAMLAQGAGKTKRWRRVGSVSWRGKADSSGEIRPRNDSSARFFPNRLDRVDEPRHRWRTEVRRYNVKGYR